MRADDLNGGSLKALLILLLVAANIIAALPRDNARTHRPQIRNAAPVERLSSEKPPH